MPDTNLRTKPATGSLMAGKRGLVMGVANDRSVAWGIAAACAAQGAELAFTYQGEALEKRVRPLAAGVGSAMVVPCDVSDDASMDAAFAQVAEEWGQLDFLVHSIGWADKAFLRGRYMDTPREAFLTALDISCYSFTAVCARATPLMRPGGSMLTMTYLGAERVMPISAGPIKTLAASGIGDFRYILKWNQYNSPLERNTTIEEVGGAAVYLLSDLASGVTGEVHHVDSGYHTVGMKNPKAPDINVSGSD